MLMSSCVLFRRTRDRRRLRWTCGWTRTSSSSSSSSMSWWFSYTFRWLPGGFVMTLGDILMIFQWYSVKNQWFLVLILFKKSLIFAWKIMILHVLVDKNHQNRSKTIKKRKIHPGAFSKFFSFFFCKICFFAYFSYE